MSQGTYSQDDKDITEQPDNEIDEPRAGFGMENTSPPKQRGKDATRKRSSRARRDDAGAGTRRRKPESNADSLSECDDTPEMPEIIELPLRGMHNGESEPPDEVASEALLGELEAQGFTEDEAYHLMYVSDRVANSRETREAEAIIRRLRFNRWLFEQGKLSEFSA
jgi:hypothetical protein